MSRPEEQYRQSVTNPDQQLQDVLEAHRQWREAQGAAVVEWWGKITANIHTWMKETFIPIYLQFQDAGLVEPLYDPHSTCGSIEDEWEVFDH